MKKFSLMLPALLLERLQQEADRLSAAKHRRVSVACVIIDTLVATYLSGNN